MRTFPIDLFQLPDVEPMDGAEEYYIRPTTQTATDLQNAFAAMNGRGGNVIRFLEGPHEIEARARGEMMGGLSWAKDGADGRENTFTGDPGHSIRAVQTGDQAFPAIDLAAVRFWGAIGLNIIGSDQAGIRVQTGAGSKDHPLRIWGNRIDDCASAAIAAQAWWRAPFTPSAHVDIRGNEITGGAGPRPELREGIYVGTGFNPRAGHPEWVDKTSNVTIACNRISGVGSDAIEIKTGVTDFVIEHNEIFDIELARGTEDTSIPVGFLSVIYANTLRPGGDQPVRGIVRGNRLWNLTQAHGDTPRPPILIGRGGVQCYSNIVWDCEAPAAIQLRSGNGGMGVGEILVANNSSDGPVVDNFAGYDDLVERDNNSNDGTVQMVGPLHGTADNGWGPGSGFTPGEPELPWVPGPMTDATAAPFTDPPPVGALNAD